MKRNVYGWPVFKPSTSNIATALLVPPPWLIEMNRLWFLSRAASNSAASPVNVTPLSVASLLTRPEPFVPSVIGATVRIATGTAVPSAARYGPCVWFHPYVARPNLFHVFVSVIGVP